MTSKTILITGSSRGIGAATARIAKEQGYNVILHGKTESDELKSLAKELNSKYIVCDITDENKVKEEVNKLGNIDVLVNSAGINISKTFEDMTNEILRNTFEANVVGTVNFIQAVLPKMKKNKYGRIVNLSSIRGFPYTTGKAAYGISKASIILMSASLAKEVALDGITVNSVAPGFTNTKMFADSLKNDDRIQGQVNTIPMKRAGEPSEIAQAILFLGSDKASYITGQSIVVDGGFSVR